MHPNYFLENLWSKPILPEVFVAMSFDPVANDRYDNIFYPAITQTAHAGTSLTPNRVDKRRSGESILTEVVDGVAHSQLILIDVTVQHRYKDARGKSVHSFNDNVMYEAGLAMACRSSTEVMLVRDKHGSIVEERTPFDLFHIPYTTFDSTDVDASVASLILLMSDRLRELDIIRGIRFDRAMRSLTPSDLEFLTDERVRMAVTDLTLSVSPEHNGLASNMAVTSLLNKGVIELVSIIDTSGRQSPQYRPTQLGAQIISDLNGSSLHGIYWANSSYRQHMKNI